MEIVACVIGIHKWQWGRRPNAERVVECIHCGKVGYDLSVMKGYRSREKPDPGAAAGDRSGPPLRRE